MPPRTPFTHANAVRRKLLSLLLAWLQPGDIAAAGGITPRLRRACGRERHHFLARGGAGLPRSRLRRRPGGDWRVAALQRWARDAQLQ